MQLLLLAASSPGAPAGAAGLQAARGEWGAPRWGKRVARGAAYLQDPLHACGLPPNMCVPPIIALPQSTRMLPSPTAFPACTYPHHCTPPVHMHAPPLHSFPPHPYTPTLLHLHAPHGCSAPRCTHSPVAQNAILLHTLVAAGCGSFLLSP